MSQETFIQTHKIDHAVCDKIIDFYAKNRRFAQAGRLGDDHRIDKSKKNSMDLSIPVNMFRYFDPFFDLLIKHVDEYVGKYFYAAGAVGFGALGIAEVANIQWYPKGGGYPAVHCERDRHYYCNRALVWMLYLTDTPGGGTAFPHQDLITDCVKGDLLLWPTDMSHMHKGVVSKTHEKMIITGWVNFISADTKPVNDPGSNARSEPQPA